MAGPRERNEPVDRSNAAGAVARKRAPFPCRWRWIGAAMSEVPGRITRVRIARAQTGSPDGCECQLISNGDRHDCRVGRRPRTLLIGASYIRDMKNDAPITSVATQISNGIGITSFRPVACSYANWAIVCTGKWIA